jgi:YHS domain-containing protein
MKRKLVAITMAVFFIGAWLLPLAADAKYDVPDLLRAKRAHAASVEKTPSGEAAALCPVTGMKADKSVFVTHNGKKIHFCCAKCKEPFANNPEKYLR